MHTLKNGVLFVPTFLFLSDLFQRPTDAASFLKPFNAFSACYFYVSQEKKDYPNRYGRILDYLRKIVWRENFIFFPWVGVYTRSGFACLCMSLVFWHLLSRQYSNLRVILAGGLLLRFIFSLFSVWIKDLLVTWTVTPL